MQSLKIEYVNGVLVSLERDGKSYMGLPVSTVHFTHSMKTTPYLKVEIEAGGEPYTPPAKQAPAPAAAAPASARVSEQPPAREGELLPQEENQKQRSRRNRNHRNHRSQ
nr:MAG TPA: hypothetical protein [Caudoviricetes sp.]